MTSILYIHPHFTLPGGAGKFVLETGERLAKKGHNVTVLSQCADANLIDGYPHINFQYFNGPLPGKITHWIKLPDLIKRMDDAIKRMDVDVLFPQVFPANYWGFLLKRKHPDIPCIWYCHDPNAYIHNKDIISGLKQPMKTIALASNPLMKLIDRRIISYSDNIIANSGFTSFKIKQIYNRDSTVVYPGVDVSKYTVSNEKENFIFTMALLTKFKRIDILLRAMVHINGLHLYIGGDGEEKENLVTLSKKLGISNKVTFLGKLYEKDTYHYLSKAKAVISLSKNEPFGIMPLEAMASGTPVIAISSGGLRETVIDGKTGFLVDNMDELISRIQLVSNDALLCNSLAINSRKHVEDNFSWDKTTNGLLNVFKQAITK